MPAGASPSRVASQVTYRIVDLGSGNVFEGEIEITYKDVCRSDVTGEQFLFLPSGPYYAPSDGKGPDREIPRGYFEGMYRNGGVGSTSPADYAMERVLLDQGLCIQETEQMLDPVREVLRTRMREVLDRAQAVPATPKQLPKHNALLRMISFDEAARLGEIHPGGPSRIPKGPQWLAGLTVAFDVGQLSKSAFGPYAKYRDSFLLEGLHEWVDAEPLEAGKRLTLGPSYEDDRKWTDKLDRRSDRSPTVGVRYVRAPKP